MGRDRADAYAAAVARMSAQADGGGTSDGLADQAPQPVVNGAPAPRIPWPRRPPTASVRVAKPPSVPAHTPLHSSLQQGQADAPKEAEASPASAASAAANRPPSQKKPKTHWSGVERGCALLCLGLQARGARQASQAQLSREGACETATEGELVQERLQGRFLRLQGPLVVDLSSRRQP